MTSEAGRVFSALVAMMIFSLSQAAEIKSSERVIVTPTPNPFSILVVQLTISSLVIIGLVVLLRELALGFLSLLAKPEPEEVIDSYTFYNRQDYNGPQGFRSLGNSESFVTRILNSIDPVESAFAIMNVDEVACRERTVCELHGAAARMPLVGALLRYMSPFIRGLDNYKEARDAGEALEDCALLFAECPYSMIQ